MDGAQITILIIAGIIIAFFIKYKITGSIKNDFILLGKTLDRGYGLLAAISMMGAAISAFCAIMLIYSLITPPTASISTTITGKEHKYHGVKYGHSYQLFLSGEEGRDRHLVSAALYKTVTQGDNLRVNLSRFFHEWRQVEVLRDNTPIYRINEGERILPALFALLFLAPLYSARLVSRFEKERILGSVIFILLILFELIPLGILINR